MRIENNTLKVTIADMLEEIKETMCDKYCKYPAFFPTMDQEELKESYCDYCPMNILL